jgi:hypothetical protein
VALEGSEDCAALCQHQHVGATVGHLTSIAERKTPRGPRRARVLSRPEEDGAGNGARALSPVAPSREEAVMLIEIALTHACDEIGPGQLTH